MSAAERAAPLTAAQIRALFADLADHPTVILAVSGGPDSTALLALAARWRKALRRGPKLVAVTVDHGLRAEARREAVMVKRLARSLGVAHRTLRWSGRKPSTGLQDAARNERYRLLGQAARAVAARHVLTAHTLDDQAETVLIRLTRGSGVSGLAAMARIAPLPGDREGAISLVRPLLAVRKRQLVATLGKAGVAFAEDPSNRDPRFARARLRAAMPSLEREGLSAERLALLARRVRRADAALEAVVDAAMAVLAPPPWPEAGPIAFPLARLARLPAEVCLRLLGRAIAGAGDEGPVELGKLEALHEGLGAQLAASSGAARFRRTLAGAVITRQGDLLLVERAPTRRGRYASNRP